MTATCLARLVPHADVPAPNLLSAKLLARIGGGRLYAPSSSVPWATLWARTFEVDVKACSRCCGRLEVRAVMTDPVVARTVLDTLAASARAPPSTVATLVGVPAFA